MENVSGPMGYPEEKFVRLWSLAFLKIAEREALRKAFAVLQDMQTSTATKIE